MSEIDEPELHVIKFPDSAGADWRAEALRLRKEARRRYIEHLAAALAGFDDLPSRGARAAAVPDALTEWNDVGSGDRCGCTCHPRLPSDDLHDFGFACTCQKTAEERARHWDEWFAERDAYWSSPEGEQITAARDAEERELVGWLAEHPDIGLSPRRLGPGAVAGCASVGYVHGA